MKNNLRLGRVAGVTVEANWTVLVIAAIVTLSVGGALLPGSIPGYGAAAYLTAGAVAAFGLLASILVHELGHATVARRNGVNVDRISLWALGGVAQLEGEAPDARTEFKIAGVGPAISVGVGLALLGPAWLVGGLVGGVLGWLASINLLLAAFNLIPGAPLDGGRLLHAWLWSRHGDRNRATATATKAGRAVGTGLIALGFLLFLNGGAGGLWTALVGWFLRNAATAEGRYAVVDAQLAGVRVRDVMTPAGPAVPEWLSVTAFIDRHVAAEPLPAYFLETVDGTNAGLVTLEAVATVPEAERFTTSVRTIARPVSDLPAVHADEPAARLLSKLGLHPIAVVWEESEPVGTVTSARLAETLQTARLLATLRNRTPSAA